MLRKFLVTFSRWKTNGKSLHRLTNFTHQSSVTKLTGGQKNFKTVQCVHHSLLQKCVLVGPNCLTERLL